MDRGHEWSEYELPGINLFHERGRWYIILHGPTDPVPAAVADIVEEISLFDSISFLPKREAGIYHYESAEAEVEPENVGKGEMRNRVRIRAKKMDDLMELLRKIKTGSIRPEQSYEGPQGGVSRAELEANLAEASRKLRDADTTISRLGTDIYKQDLKLKNLKTGLDEFLRAIQEGSFGGMLFCSKEQVARRLLTILNKGRD